MYKTLTTLLASLIVSLPCFALEISISDSLGNVRHVQEVSGPANVRIAATSSSGLPTEGATVTITKKATANTDQALNTAPDLNQSRQGVIVAGIVEFPDVAPGEWVISSNPDSLILTEINVFDPNSMMAQADLTSTTGISTGGVIGGLAVIGATTFITLEATDDDNDDPSPSS